MCLSFASAYSNNEWIGLFLYADVNGLDLAHLMEATTPVKLKNKWRTTAANQNKWKALAASPLVHSTRVYILSSIIPYIAIMLDIKWKYFLPFISEL